MKTTNKVNHLAIIMDGNARWALARGVSKSEGHRVGANNVKKLLPVFTEMHIPYVTLYTFSSENWNRSKTEIAFLLKLLQRYLKEEATSLHENGVRIKVIGRLDQISKSLQKQIQDSVELTKHNTTITLCIAFSYGGRAEIIDACQKIINSGKPEITEEEFKAYLYDNEMPDVDLLIRTSGELRITRILSALVLGPVFIIAIMFSKYLFYLLMLLITVGMCYEWWQMSSFWYTKLGGRQTSLIYTIRLFAYRLLGFIILPISPMSLALIAGMETHSWLLLVYFVIIWSVDTFAMIGGKTLKGPKLAPQISPGKTWSGLVVGALSSGVSAFLLSLLPSFTLSEIYVIENATLIIAATVLALIAQMSDLFISYFKRKFAIKDSGTIIPGHGGVLDRFDSIILTAPILLKIILNIFLFLLLMYFVFHSIYGGRGIIAYFSLNQQLEKAYSELEMLRDERIELEHKVKLLRPESLDRDMLDQEARRVLGVALPNE
ncbi:Isoprenyl transferase, partial [Pseudolycoriella hygida]